MSMLRTFYRAVVMVAAGVIVVKGWQLYGPSTASVKAFAVEAMDKAQAAWGQSRSQTQPPATLAEDPRPQVAPLDAAAQNVAQTTAPPFAAAGGTVTAPELSAISEDGSVLVAASPAADGQSERLPQLLARLENMGCADPQLGAWGSSGKLYRFSCQAQLGDTAAFTQHFEAVAEQPVEAVEQVVAHVEAWRDRQGRQ
jgi:hypothetical protein